MTTGKWRRDLVTLPEIDQWTDEDPGRKEFGKNQEETHNSVDNTFKSFVCRPA